MGFAEINYEDRGEWNCHVHVHLWALVLDVFNLCILLLKCTLLHYCVHQSVRQCDIWWLRQFSLSQWSNCELRNILMCCYRKSYCNLVNFFSLFLSFFFFHREGCKQDGPNTPILRRWKQRESAAVVWHPDDICHVQFWSWLRSGNEWSTVTHPACHEWWSGCLLVFCLLHGQSGNLSSHHVFTCMFVCF